MPDLFLLIAIIVFVVAGIVAFLWSMEEREPAALILVLMFGLGTFGVGKWWHWAYQGRTWETVAAYPLQDLDTVDGSLVQVFVVNGTIYNATSRWGRVFPEGTWVRELKSFTEKRRGVSFWMAGESQRFEIIKPNEASPPMERIEDGS